jgi:hypothetical protein
MKLRFFAAIVAAVALFLAFSASATPAMAQVGKATVVPAAFGDHSMIQGFALPEEGQGAYVWVYDSAANEILFYHSDGVGPSLHWPLHTETLRDLGVSDDGHFAVLVTNKSVEVHTLELRRPPHGNRLAGISTPRLRLRLIVEGALSATIAGDNLLVLFADRLEVHPLKMRVFLPMVKSDVCTPPECVRGEDPGELPPTPERGGPGVPTRTPAACTPGPNDPCATPPAVATAEPPEEPPVGPPDTPEPILP